MRDLFSDLNNYAWRDMRHIR